MAEHWKFNEPELRQIFLDGKEIFVCKGCRGIEEMGAADECCIFCLEPDGETIHNFNITFGKVSNMDDEAYRELQKKIKALCNVEDGLSKWEVDFVDDVSKYAIISLSKKQIATIERLYERFC